MIRQRGGEIFAASEYMGRMGQCWRCMGGGYLNSIG